MEAKGRLVPTPHPLPILAARQCCHGDRERRSDRGNPPCVGGCLAQPAPNLAGPRVGSRGPRAPGRPRDQAGHLPLPPAPRARRPQRGLEPRGRPRARGQAAFGPTRAPPGPSRRPGTPTAPRKPPQPVLEPPLFTRPRTRLWSGRGSQGSCRLRSATSCARALAHGHAVHAGAHGARGRPQAPAPPTHRGAPAGLRSNRLVWGKQRATGLLVPTRVSFMTRAIHVRQETRDTHSEKGARALRASGPSPQHPECVCAPCRPRASTHCSTRHPGARLVTARRAMGRAPRWPLSPSGSVLVLCRHQLVCEELSRTRVIANGPTFLKTLLRAGNVQIYLKPPT